MEDRFNSEEMCMEVTDQMHEVMDGERDALSTYIELYKLSKVLKEAMDTIKDSAIDEARLHGKGEHEQDGVKFQVKASGGRWSYKGLEWYKTYKELEKEAQEAFKAAERGHQYITDQGEVIVPAEYTPGRDTISIRL